MRGGLRLNRPTSGATAPAAGTRGRADVRSSYARPDMLLYAVAALIMTYVWRVQDVVPVLGVARPAVLLLGVAALAAVLRPDMASGVQRLRSPVLIHLAILLAFVAAAAPFGLDPGGTMRFLGWSLLPTALLAAFTAFSARALEDLEWIVLATLIGAIGYTLVMYATHPLDETGRWTPLVHYNPNGLALLLVGLIPPTFYFMRPGERRARRVFAAACFVLFTAMIARTGSRGGFLGFGVVLVYLLATYRAVPARLRRWGAVGAVLLLAAAGPRYWERMSTMLEPSRDYNWSGAEYTGRGELWRRGLDYIKSRPIAGVGANGFQTAELELSEVARRRQAAGRRVQALVAHSVYIQIAAELGLVGLGVFLALLGRAAYTLMSVRRRAGPDSRVGAFAHVLLASLLGYAVCGLFQSAAYFGFFYLLLGLIAATGSLVVLEPRLRGRGGLAAVVPSSPLAPTGPASMPPPPVVSGASPARIRSAGGGPAGRGTRRV